MELDEIKKMVIEAKTNLDNIEKINASLLNKLPAEYDQQKTEIIEDISRINNMVQKSDLSGLNDLLKKYADNNTK
jgi:hypothetical protein